MKPACGSPRWTGQVLNQGVIRIAFGGYSVLGGRDCQNRDVTVIYSHNMFQAEKRGKSPPETWGKGDSQYRLGFLGTATWNGGTNGRKPGFSFPTCQVRVSRFYHGCIPPPAAFCLLPSAFRLHLNHELQISVGTAGPNRMPDRVSEYVSDRILFGGDHSK